MVFVLNAVKGLCSESAPVRFTMAATAVFIWGWFTMLMFIGLIMYCRKKMDVYRQKRRKIEKEEENFWFFIFFTNAHALSLSLYAQWFFTICSEIPS